MGVAVRGSFSRLHGQTDELVDWITKVRVKKNTVKKMKTKNLRMEAVLASTLVTAETELKVRQQQRYQKWQRLKNELVRSANCGDVCNSNGQQWDEKTLEDINSINCFMSMLKEVKNPLQR